jgi:hypothetical protein
MSAPGNKIPFEQFVSIDQHYARLLARDPDVKPLYLRVMFAAIGWSNLIGHAEFAAGGLATILQSSDPRTGELSIPNRSQTNAAIRRAEAMNLISAGSSRYCLLAPTWWAKSGGNGGKTCNHHGIYSRRRRHKKSVDSTSERHKRSVDPTQEKCHSDAVTSDDAHLSMNLLSFPLGEVAS